MKKQFKIGSALHFHEPFHTIRSIFSTPAAPARSRTVIPNRMQYSVCFRLRSRLRVRFLLPMVLKMV